MLFQQPFISVIRTNFAGMEINTVIFDMDGLLIDSEPLWNEAAFEQFQKLGITLDKKQFSLTTGLRTKEFVTWWFDHFKLDNTHLQETESEIIRAVTNKVLDRGKAQPGISHILNFFMARKFKIGLASSSPISLINTVIDYLGIRGPIQAITSGASLEYGKPHPQVYLNCADQLKASPLECITFEDSYNGMVAAKAARMKCVVVPAVGHLNDPRWHAADLKISSLQNFNELLMNSM